MLLIGDIGSTKADWIVLNEDGKPEPMITTKGFNPYTHDVNKLAEILQSEMPVYIRSKITAVRYYGAGCTPAKVEAVKAILQSFFDTEDVEIYSDLMAAVHSLGQGSECIAAILGTGSNSCYYDGQTITEQTPSLGYILGDEGSGGVLGRKLLRNILKKQFPPEMISDFFDTYPIDLMQIVEKVYHGDAPNRFMASFVPFLKEHIEDINVYFMVEEDFFEFIERNLLNYTKIKELPVHFTGSIAYHFKEQLQYTLQFYNLSLGEVTCSPIDGLVKYYSTVH
jgi:Predicted N-acetylglucosamine kinase